MNRGNVTLLRLCGALAGAATLAALVMGVLALVPELRADVARLMVFAGGLLGAVAGALVLPGWVRAAQLTLTTVTTDELGGIVVGSLIGVALGALLSVPLGFLPTPLRQVFPIVIALLVSYIAITTLRQRPHDMIDWWQKVMPASIVTKSDGGDSDHAEAVILLDTSVIIDGRITDISRTGFLMHKIVVPNFVLAELQHIADSPDPIRRKRGRRGLEVLNVLRNDCPIPFEISDMDVSEVREVDAKLVALARHLSCPVMTNDYNLNRVAGLHGVSVLNINELANAVKAAYLPGEEVHVRVIQEGREQGQGVGYLDDGTMVVIEDGRDHMNAAIDVVVTKVLQTSAGRMIFARIPY